MKITLALLTLILLCGCNARRAYHASWDGHVWSCPAGADTWVNEKEMSAGSHDYVYCVPKTPSEIKGIETWEPHYAIPQPYHSEPLRHAATPPRSLAGLRLDSLRVGLLPRGWNLVPISEADWLIMSRYHIATATAFTYLDARTTFIRENYVLTAPAYRVRHTIAHEAGHIACACRDESAAERWANANE